MFGIKKHYFTEEMERVQEASALPSEVIISTIISFFITYAKEVIFTLFFFSHLCQPLGLLVYHQDYTTTTHQSSTKC